MTDVIGTVFTKLSESKVEEYAKVIENKAKKDHPNFISGDEFKKRIELWKLNKNKWVDTHISTNTVVRFFEVPTAGFLNDETNYMVLGINASNSQIDLIVGNDTGLYDMVRPVPPFPRNTKWPKWPF